MTKLQKIISIILVAFMLNLWSTNAEEAKLEIEIIENPTFIISPENISTEEIKEIEELKEAVTISYAFNFFASLIDEVPSSYKYIQLNFKNIETWSKIEDSLKKLVYLDRITNSNIDLQLRKEINAVEFYTMAKNILNIWITIDTKELSWRNVNMKDLTNIRNIYYSIWENIEQEPSTTYYSSVLWDRQAIFDHIFETLIRYHYDNAKISKEDLIYSAMEWLATGTNDIHTVYFPPLESQNFEDNLSWEYEWIGAYVEMASPWVVRITSPVPWSPAEKAGIKWWDIILKVDEKEVTKDNSLTEVTSWIKWPTWTTVKLTILRDLEEIEIDVYREKITINNLETNEFYPNIYYIKITSFWAWVSNEFKEVIEDLKTKTGVKKIIIDLRSNGWWYLNEVTEMLSYLVAKDKNVAAIKYVWYNENHYSKWYDWIDLSKYEVVILQNSWTASASEIMIGTLNDYFPNIVIIWENTYWKGSVQTLLEYVDGSSLKYTIAKWYTWWTETWIDWVWIAPDIELELDIEAYQEWTDNQLDAAINY